MFIDVWRIFILILWIWILLYFFVPSVEIWCHSRWSSWRSHFSTLDDFLKDRQVEISEEDRKPKETISQFYANGAQEGRLFQMQIRSLPLQQTYPGTVLTNGKHASLPSGLMWQNGIVTTGDVK